MRKKKGSSLLLVLGITFILIAVGGVVATSIMHTTGQHNNVKVESDLTYAAESGIEEAYSKIKSKNVVLADGQAYPTYEISSMFTNEGIEVKVDISRSGSKYTVISEARKGGKISKVKGILDINKVFVPGVNEIFKYVMCAKTADIQIGGDLENGVTLWNISDLSNSDMKHSVVDNPPGVDIIGQVVNEGFILPEFSIGKSGDLEVTDVSQLYGKPGVAALVYDKSKPVGARIVHKLTDTGPLPPYSPNNFIIYLVNFNSKTNCLKLNIAGSVDVNNTAIIANGIVKVGNNGFDLSSPPTLFLNKSTILAERIELRLAAFGSKYRVIDNDAIEHDLIESVADLKEINEHIGTISGNWNGNTGNENGEDIIVGDIEYMD